MQKFRNEFCSLFLRDDGNGGISLSHNLVALPSHPHCTSLAEYGKGGLLLTLPPDVPGYLCFVVLLCWLREIRAYMCASFVTVQLVGRLVNGWFKSSIAASMMVSFNWHGGELVHI